MVVKTCLISPKIENVELKNIIFYNKNIRKSVGENEIISMAESIKKNGLLIPLFIRKNIDNKNGYILVSGYRRLLALEYLSFKKAPAIILSLTETEADVFTLCEDEHSKKLSLFEKAEIIARILKSGRITKFELAEALGISENRILKILSVLEIEVNQRKKIFNMGFSNEFIFEFIKIKNEEREKILNDIIVKNFSNSMAIDYIKRHIKREKEPIRSVCLSDDSIVLNSLERIVENLKEIGIAANFKRNENDEKTEYSLIIEKKLRQN